MASAHDQPAVPSERPCSRTCSRRREHGPHCHSLTRILGVLLVLILTSPLTAQAQLASGTSSWPGEGISRREFPRSGATPGYFQPVLFTGSESLRVAWVVQSRFVEPRQAPLQVGLHIGACYRFKVTGISGEDEGTSVYPSVQLCDRLYAPVGQSAKFPIPIEFNEDDLRTALGGRFVTRVIYVEDPDSALPINHEPHKTPWYEAAPHVDPWQEAKRWGRPLAIIRIGGRQPDERFGADVEFATNVAPLIVFQTPATEPPSLVVPAAANRSALLQQGIK